MSIEQARAAFDRADPPTGLARLLEAWSTLRLPRIADLIQHVSDALVAAAPPIEDRRGDLPLVDVTAQPGSHAASVPAPPPIRPQPSATPKVDSHRAGSGRL